MIKYADVVIIDGSPTNFGQIIGILYNNNGYLFDIGLDILEKHISKQCRKMICLLPAYDITHILKYYSTKM